jgi:broad specificity phosphatase PhoE
MAEAFAQAYRSIPWTAAYVSPMKRTIATARPLCEVLGLEMQLRDGLKEIRYGKWEDKTLDFVKQHVGMTISTGWRNQPGMRQPGVKPRWRFPIVR